MTQSKPKSKPTQKKMAPFDQAYKLLDQCSTEELNALTDEINQLIWERQLVAEADANPAPGSSAEEVFARLKERYKSRKGA